MIFDVDKATLTQQLDGSVTVFLSRLLMMDYVAMTDQNWPSPSRRDPGMNDVVPDFSGSEIILQTKFKFLLELINWKTDIRFFNTYISNLDLFLDSNKLKDSIKRRKKNDLNYSKRSTRMIGLQSS